jgi:hypothetical protein
MEDAWSRGLDAVIEKLRRKHMEAVRLIMDHAVFAEQKGMLSQVLGEPDISDEDAAVTIYLYICGTRRFKGTKQVFEKEHWDRRSRFIHGICEEGEDFEERFDANAFITLFDAIRDGVHGLPPSEDPMRPIESPRVTANTFATIGGGCGTGASDGRLLAEMLWDGGASGGNPVLPSAEERKEVMEYDKGLEGTIMEGAHEEEPPEVEPRLGW